MISITDVALIVADIRYKAGWRLHVGTMGDGYFLQVQFLAPDNDAPDAREALQPQNGRKWYISRHMTPSEVVQTAFLAVKVAEEHEMRELFLYRGQRIFGPHFNACALARFAAKQLPDHRPGPVRVS